MPACWQEASFSPAQGCALIEAPTEPICILSPIDVHACLCSHPCSKIPLTCRNTDLHLPHVLGGIPEMGALAEVAAMMCAILSSLCLRHWATPCAEISSVHFFFLIPLCSPIKLKLKLPECLHLVCAKRDHMLCLCAFLPSLFVAAKRGEQKGLRVLAGLSSA